MSPKYFSLALFSIFLSIMNTHPTEIPDLEEDTNTEYKKINPESCGTKISPRRHRRVAHGTHSAQHAWPWTASIQYKDELKDGTVVYNHCCGAALINPLWAVTAAHCCVDVKSHGDIRLVFGAYDINAPKADGKSVKIRKIAKAFEHPKYIHRHDSPDYDIMLIKLEKPMKPNRYIRPVCVANKADKEPKPGDTCVMAGWGENNHEHYDGYLRDAKFIVITKELCSQRWGKKLTKDNVCIWDMHDYPCAGDSGSSLVCESKKDNRWYTAGVFSWGTKKCADDWPSVFTAVRPAIDWIEEIIKEN